MVCLTHHHPGLTYATQYVLLLHTILSSYKVLPTKIYQHSSIYNNVRTPRFVLGQILQIHIKRVRDICL